MKLSCDICGRTEARAIILIEGAKMVACGRCMRNGKIVHRLDDEGVEIAKTQAPRGHMETSEEIIENYGKTIRRARDKMGVKMSVIAEKIQEKESYLDAIENERLRPTFEVARKLERELGIKLIVKVESEVVPDSMPKRGKFTEPTLADALIEKKKKGK
jgi:putative transcription factor